jgi:hypothetical protein
LSVKFQREYKRKADTDANKRKPLLKLLGIYSTCPEDEINNGKLFSNVELNISPMPSVQFWQ